MASNITLSLSLLLCAFVQIASAQAILPAQPSAMEQAMQVVHNYGIQFPQDAVANCGQSPNIPSVTTFGSGCDLLVISGANGENDEIYTAEGDECYKIKRTYRVINWCHWDGESDPVVIRRDEDCDNIGGDEPVWVLVRPNNVVYLDRDNNETNNNPALGTRRCLPNPAGPAPTGHWANSNTNPELAPLAFGDPQYRSYGYYEYSQFIKVYDTTDPVIHVPANQSLLNFCSYNNTTCAGAVTVNFNITDACGLTGLATRLFWDSYVVDANNDGAITVAEFHPTAELTATALTHNGAGSYTIQGNFPIGRHAFLINAKDGCLNEATGRVVVFEVKDCKVAAPVCISAFTATLMPVDADGDGQIDPLGGMTPPIHAGSFLASAPGGDCTGPIKIAIYKTPVMTPSPADSVLFFDCTELGERPVYVYAFDGAGNKDFCESRIIIQDQNGLCETLMSIAGVIMTEDDEPLPDVQVSISGVGYMEETNEQGQFSIAMPNSDDYTVVPHLDSSPANGLSTFDLVLVSRHILQITPLDSPYKLIAADANNSGSITTLDVIQIRRVILNQDPEFPNNLSWRFVDADYVFPDPANPWLEPFPEVFNLNNATPAEYGNIHFVAVKIGDVNNSASVNLRRPEDGEE